MDIFVLGGTGLIGRGVVRELVHHGHRVDALSRSPVSDTCLRALGARPVRGDMRDPEAWCERIGERSAVVQVAATFEDDMAAVDALVLDALEGVADQRSRPLRIVYTGGCWLYGTTGEEVADESRLFAPIPAFAWMVDHARRLMESDAFDAAILHPAMVYAKGEGAFDRFIAAARENRSTPIWGSPETRWPLVHRDDLAVAYRLALEAGLMGHYNAAAEDGVRVGRIADEIARRTGSTAGITVRTVDEVVAEHGSWAIGPTLDQRITAAKLREAAGWTPRHARFENAELL